MLRVVFFHDLIVKVGDTRYNADLSVTQEESCANAYFEFAPLLLGVVGLEMLNAISTATEDVKVRITGTNGDINFVLTAAQLAEAQQWNTLYIEAGGADQETIPLLDVMYPIAIAQQRTKIPARQSIVGARESNPTRLFVETTCQTPFSRAWWDARRTWIRTELMDMKPMVNRDALRRSRIKRLPVY